MASCINRWLFNHQQQEALSLTLPDSAWFSPSGLLHSPHLCLTSRNPSRYHQQVKDEDDQHASEQMHKPIKDFSSLHQIINRIRHMYPLTDRHERTCACVHTHAHAHARAKKPISLRGVAKQPQEILWIKFFFLNLPWRDRVKAWQTDTLMGRQSD